MKFGRFLLLLVSILCMTRLALAQKEADVGQYLDRLVRDNYQVLEVPAIQESIASLGAKIVESSGNPNRIKVTFTVLNDPIPRAFTGPGGYIYITSGLLALATSRDEVAGVLAHEVAHMNKRHSTRFMKTPKSAIVVVILTRIGGEIAAGYTSQTFTQWASSSKTYYNPWMAQMTANQLANSMLTLVNSLGVMAINAIYKNYTADDELEADALAVDYCRKAGFDASQIPDILNKVTGFSTPGVDAIPGWHRDLASDQYPKLQERIRRIEVKVGRSSSRR